jgi:hypothetical protein
MAKNKTVETNNSVAGYLKAIPDAKRRQDCADLIDLMSEQSGFEAKMWGPGIVGFGSYHYKYDSGHEGTAPLAGLASRANAISLYLNCEQDKKEALLAKLGKYKMAKACIYVQKFADIDPAVLGKLVKASVAYYQKKYPA